MFPDQLVAKKGIMEDGVCVLLAVEEAAVAVTYISNPPYPHMDHKAVEVSVVGRRAPERLPRDSVFTAGEQ